MRDFEQDRRFLADRKDGYVTDEVFARYADDGWPAALQEIKHMSESCRLAGDAIKGLLDEIEILKRQLEVATDTVVNANCSCPYWEVEEFDTNKCGNAIDCWLEYWRLKKGFLGGFVLSLEALLPNGGVRLDGGTVNSRACAPNGKHESGTRDDTRPFGGVAVHSRGRGPSV